MILNGIQRDIWIVIGILALYMLRGKLSFLCGRRREGELPLQLWDGLWEQSSEKRLEVSLSWVIAKLQELTDCRWIRTKEWKIATSRLYRKLIVLFEGEYLAVESCLGLQVLFSQCCCFR